MKKLFLFLAALSAAAAVSAQGGEGSAQWNASVKQFGNSQYEVLFEAQITPGWHMYDLGPYDFPMATAFDFSDSAGLELIGEPYQLDEPHRYFDKVFGFEVGYFEGTARFAQKVQASGAGAVLAGEVHYQICDDESCIQGDWGFKIKVTEGKPAQTQAAAQSAGGDAPGKPLWRMILEAVLWGFAALLTPCVFPMVPMTVSFFIKDGGSKAAARFRALMFGFFIVALYTVPIGVVILTTFIAGGETVTADIFNWLSTHWLPNVLFSIVFMVFAASLLGAFEIRMPSKLINRSDKNADKEGLLGVFFLALTLVLVSFSCTGPIVGTVLIKSTQGEFWAPILTMFVFSLAFALPFTMLAFFPSLMRRLPKSGGWLNSVKVTLGFVEIALGLKFLSIADQTYHWGILDREVYLALWIVTFSLLGVYFLGKIRFKYDNEVQSISVGRLTLAIITFSFVMYMIPGMWGAPLKGISGYLPPMSTQDFVIAGNARETVGHHDEKIKYADILHLPHGMIGFFDFEQGMEYARKVGKPVFLDFTGHGCVNCREMEERVWVDSEIQRILREDFVVIALYSDDRAKLPESDWQTTAGGNVLKTLGKRNSYLMNTRFGISSQPAYLLLDNDGNLLVPARGYNLSIPDYIAFLRSGIDAYGSRNTQ